MGKYLAPLKIFVIGQLLLLIFWLFLPAIGAAGDKLATDTAAVASTFWGWGWASNSTRILVVIIGELMVLGMTAVVFMKSKN